MKKLVAIFSLLFLLIGCSGSDAYTGLWKATDKEGKQFEVNFKKDSFEVKDESANTTMFKYSQNSVKISNGVKSYGIKLDDGRTYQIVFPVANNTNVGIITLETGEPFYTISRDAYITYDEIYKLQ